MKTRRAIPEIFLITLLSWVLKGFEWFFLGLSLGNNQYRMVGFFLLHPLITAFGFVPLTPSGIGFQEGAIVGIFLLLGVDIRLAVAFAILSQGSGDIRRSDWCPPDRKICPARSLATTRLITKD